MKKKRRRLKKKPIICLILILVLFSNTFMLSKYVSAINGVASTDVGKFDVSIITSDNASDTLSMLSGTTEATYIVKVTSNSEVATSYEIILSNVPDGLQVSLDNGLYQTPVNSTITFAGNNCSNCIFSSNSLTTEHTHTLKFFDPLSSSNAGVNSINIDVEFTQVD